MRPVARASPDARSEVEIVVAVVLVGDVHVMTGPHVVPDLDREVADDATAPSDEAPVADAHDGSVRHTWPGTIPADRVTCGPIIVPGPMWM